jgi:L-ribulokinase
MGTSASDMVVSPETSGAETRYTGVEGQAEGSMIPGLTSIEAGQSAFGDILDWFAGILAIQTREGNEGRDMARDSSSSGEILSELSKLAARRLPSESAPVALDWHAGRRSPGVNHALRSTIEGLTLGHDAVDVFRAHVEGLAFGARRIHESLREQAVPIERVRGVGGVARKSPLLLQTLADVLGVPIEVCRTEEASARGAAILASVVCGAQPSVQHAVNQLHSEVESVYEPRAAFADTYDALYERYVRLADITEHQLTGASPSG